MSTPKSWSHVNNTVILTILIFRQNQCLHLMYAKIAWVLVSSVTQVQSQVILDIDYLPDYISVSYDYVNTKCHSLVQFAFKSSYFLINKFFNFKIHLFSILTTNQTKMVFFQTRLGKILICQKFS